MAAKTNPSILDRFTGRGGKKLLIDCICQQPLVGSDSVIAAEFLRCGRLFEVKENTYIIKQGDYDNDLYLIITGKVSILVNEREVAIREANTHFGEMALIDTTAQRAASVKTKERSVLLCIPEKVFSRIANKKPDLWRRTALALSTRLRERNKFHLAPHSQPVVFIGSSSESSDIAAAINKSLSNKPVIIKFWKEGVFQASKTTIEDLLKMTSDSDFAIIVLSPDDVYISRGQKKRGPRDNAVFELGLFMGALGRERAIIVTPSDYDMKIPTDILGVKCLRYKDKKTTTIGRKLQRVCKELWEIIETLGPK